MRKPNVSGDKENVYKSDTSNRFGRERSKSEGASPEDTCVKEFVYKDVYLMDRTVGRFDRNLLANSLTAKLKQNIPGEFTTKTRLMHKLRRENLKDYVQLEHLNKRYDNEMQMQTHRLENEGNLLIRRHEKMRKQTEYQRKNQDKIRAQIRNPSMKQPDTSAVFPQIKHFSQAHAVSQPPDSSTVEVHPAYQRESSATHKSVHVMPFQVDTHDMTNVKVFKYHGIYQPQNKYSSRRSSSRGSASSGGILKRDDASTPEYEILTLSMEDGESRASAKSIKSDKKRKGLRVTWSGVEREYEMNRQNNNGLSSTGNDNQGDESGSTTSTIKTNSSLRQTKRNKIENIGIKWKLPPGSKQSVRAVKSATATYASNSRSKNLMPVSGALNQNGMSVTRTRWHVPSAPPLSSYDLYREWLQKLDKLKCPVESKPFLQEVPALNRQMGAQSCTPGYGFPSSLSEPVNLSIYAASNVV